MKRIFNDMTSYKKNNERQKKMSWTANSWQLHRIAGIDLKRHIKN